MSSPRVSVIVTCFNLGAYLQETLDSIRAQTFKDYELCVVDDGSTDGHTQAVLGRLPADVPVIRTENRGLPSARNVGVAHTSGEFVCAVDADDILLPTLLERSVETLDADPGLAFASHWLEAFGDETWLWTPSRCDFPTLLDVNTLNGAALVRRAVVSAVGGWDESMRDGCEDWDFWITVVERGYRGCIIPETLFRYRRRRDSMSRVKFSGDGLVRLYRRLIEKHASSFQAHIEALLVRRDADIAGNRAAIEDLDRRFELELRPALEQRHDDVTAARRRRAQREEQERFDHLRGEAEELRSSLAALQQQVGDLQDERRSAESRLNADLEAHKAETLRLDRLRHQAQQEAGELRQSLSWRLTSPLRAVGRWARIGGRRRA